MASPPISEASEECLISMESRSIQSDYESPERFVVEYREDSPPVSPSGETAHREQCKTYFRLLRASICPFVESLPASYLCQVLKNLGMSECVDERAFSYWLWLSGYTDEASNLDFELFHILANDFKLLESIRAHKASAMGIDIQALPTEDFSEIPINEGGETIEVDRGPLGWFFDILQHGGNSGFITNDLIDAFESLDIGLTLENANILTEYALLHSGTTFTFKDFLKILHAEEVARSGRTTFSRRLVSLNKSGRLGRVMAFVSAWSESAL